jgi:hypothetical protein
MPGISDSNWQLLWVEGGGIEYWSDPEFDGWNADSPRRNLVSPCARASEEPDRVILTVSSAEHARGIPVGAWRIRIQNAVAQVQQQYPGVKQIVLQAVVGVIDSDSCPVRASRSHDDIVEAIQDLAEGMLVQGPDLKLEECEQFFDNLGHFSVTDAPVIARQAAEFYR